MDYDVARRPTPRPGLPTVADDERPMEELLYDVAGGFRKGSIFFPIVYAEIDSNLKTAGITDLLGVDGIPIELCFVS